MLVSELEVGSESSARRDKDNPYLSLLILAISNSLSPVLLLSLYAAKF